MNRIPGVARLPRVGAQHANTLPPDPESGLTSQQDVGEASCHHAGVPVPRDILTTSESMPIRDYARFYQFYLREHQNVVSRRLHVLGSLAGLLGAYRAIATGSPKPLLVGVLTGYACAWAGHFWFEKNQPASFKQPLYSFMSDWRMVHDVCRGRLSLRHASYDQVRY